MENQLQVIVKDSGLEPTKAKYILEQFQDYFDIASEWETKAKTIVVKDAEQKADMEIARVGRLFLREKRIAVENARKKLKEQSLREGKAIDGIANVLKALIVPIEEYLDKQEHFVEIQEENKRETMRLEIEKRMEDERIAKEKADAEEQERIRQENERLKKEAEEREKEIKKQQDKAVADKRASEEKLRKEREKSEAEQRKQREEIEAKARKEREAAEAKAKAEREKAIAEERAKSEKARKEREIKEAEASKILEDKIKKEQAAKKKIEKLISAGVDCPHCGKHIDLA